jgi:hypothetical protein
MLAQPQFDFDAVAPAPAPQTGPGCDAGRSVVIRVSPEVAGALVAVCDIAPTGAGSFAVGDSVYLRGAPFGKPGTVLRIERGKLAVLWADLGPSYIGRHRPDSLMLAGSKTGAGQ